MGTGKPIPLIEKLFFDELKKFHIYWMIDRPSAKYKNQRNRTSSQKKRARELRCVMNSIELRALWMRIENLNWDKQLSEWNKYFRKSGHWEKEQSPQSAVYGTFVHVHIAHKIIIIIGDEYLSKPQACTCTCTPWHRLTDTSHTHTHTARHHI